MAEAKTPDTLALMDEALRDPHWLVRGVARCELRRTQAARDFAEHYRERARRGEWTLGVVRGLGDEGAPSDWELLVPALDLRAPSLAVAAIQSMARLDRRGSREMRMMMVDDARPRVSSSAGVSLRGQVWASDVPLLRACLESPHAHVRESGALLLLEEPSWDSVIAVLASPRELSGRAAAQLLSSLRRRALGSARPGAAALAQLRRLVALSPALREVARAKASSALAVFGA